MLWGENRGKWKRPAATRSRTQDTPGLSRQCSATEPRQPDNHQPSPSSICTAQVVLNASVATWQPLSMFYINRVTEEVTRSTYISTVSYPSNIEGTLGGLPVQYSLVPRPLPDFITAVEKNQEKAWDHCYVLGRNPPFPACDVAMM